MHRIHYLSGSRADFGLMRQSLRTLAEDARFSLGVILTGQALDPRYGDVAAEVAAAGLQVIQRVPAGLSGASEAEMAMALADELRGLTRFWAKVRPDLVLLLGDRGEMLAAAIAAYHLQLPIAHIHGGERSGSLDDAFRDAVTKFATWHFPATRAAAERLSRMGELPETIHCVGAPGLVEVARIQPKERAWLLQRFAMPLGKQVALVLFHPVVPEARLAFTQTSEIIAGLQAQGYAAIILMPNSDAGGAEVERAIAQHENYPFFTIVRHLERQEYLETLATVDVLVGNSSSGIIESATLGTPCVNVGTRQDGRERNSNVVDCVTVERWAIARALEAAAGLGSDHSNVYGDGLADQRIRDALAGLPLGCPAPLKRSAF